MKCLILSSLAMVCAKSRWAKIECAKKNAQNLKARKNFMN